MWLIPSQLESDFVRASGCSKKPCDWSSPAMFVRAVASGKPTLRPFNWRGWKTRPWSRILFSAAICETSQQDAFVDWWTSSLRACRAPRSASPEAAGEWTTSGHGEKTEKDLKASSSGSSRSVSPPWSSLRMSLLMFGEDTSESLASNFADWVTRSLSRSSLLRTTLERRISANGCSSSPTAWGTPRVTTNGGIPSPQCTGRGSRLEDQAGVFANSSGAGSGVPVTGRQGGEDFQRVEKWPTPQVGTGPASHGQISGDFRNRMEEILESRLWSTPRTITGGAESAERKQELGRMESGGGDLQAQVENWPTPTLNGNNNVAGISPKAGDGLQTAALNWPTPRGEDAESSGMRHSRGVADTLTAAVSLETWITPNARDHKWCPSEEGMMRADGKHRFDQLDRQAEHLARNGHFSHPAPAAENGPESSGEARTSRRRLNPAFVCWLMGWPWWWTRAERISFAAAEMAWWRCALRSRLWSLCGAEGF